MDSSRDPRGCLDRELNILLSNRLFSRNVWMNSPMDSQSQHRRGLRGCPRGAVKHAKPAQVRRQVLGGHALEAAHPAAQAADVGIDVLHMPRPIDPNAGADVDAVVLHAQQLGRSRQRGTAVGAQHGVLGQQGRQCGAELGSAGARHDDVGRGAGAVARHEHGYLLLAHAALAAAHARPAGQQRRPFQPPGRVAAGGDPKEQA